MSNSSASGAPVVVITGANNGIGLYMAATLLEDGYRVAALDLSGDNFITLREKYPGCALFYRCDVTSDDEVNAAIDGVLRQWQSIDVLVNNACIALFSPFEDKSIEDIRREFDVNYFGYVRTIKAVLPYMKAKKKGIIHNVSSSVGFTGYAGISGYTSTKGAIEALTRTLRLELRGYGIVVNVMHPTITNTKSASPLGLPEEAMAKPEEVGRKLARKIMSTEPMVSGDLATAVGLFISQKFPGFMGSMFQSMARKAKKQ